MRCKSRRVRSETLRALWIWYCFLMPSYSTSERRRLMVLIQRSVSGIQGDSSEEGGQLQACGGQARAFGNGHGAGTDAIGDGAGPFAVDFDSDGALQEADGDQQSK